MKSEELNIVIIGLTITSSRGNGHATTYRGLVRELDRMGHRVLFLEKDVPWFSSHRDLPQPPYGKTRLYQSETELKKKYADDLRNADVVIVGSYVQEGVEVGKWVQQTAKGVKAFYDIDTPVTLARLNAGNYEYLHPELIPGYDLYLSFTGGPVLETLMKEFHSPRAKPLYCSVDPEIYYPEQSDLKWDLGYLGTYSDDRQPPLEKLMVNAARKWREGKFIVAGPQYPGHIEWPENVERVEHVPPHKHRKFYNSQRFTQNITRSDMVKTGFSPSVRLFEAAACGVPIISDYWDGLDSVFDIGDEILISRNEKDTLAYLREMTEQDRAAIGARARRKVLGSHTAARRAEELISYISELRRVAQPSA